MKELILVVQLFVDNQRRDTYSAGWSITLLLYYTCVEGFVFFSFTTGSWVRRVKNSADSILAGILSADSRTHILQRLRTIFCA